MRDSGWPQGYTPPGPPDYLEALGALILAFNQLEMSLWALFKRYLDRPRARDYLFNELNNNARLGFLRALLEEERDRDFAQAARHALACFAVCCENRNFIAHAMPHETLMTKRFRFLKRLTKEPGRIGVFEVPVSDIREAVTAISSCDDYIIRLADVHRQRGEGHKVPLPTRPDTARTLAPKAPPKSANR